MQRGNRPDWAKHDQIHRTSVPQNTKTSRQSPNSINGIAQNKVSVGTQPSQTIDTQPATIATESLKSSHRKVGYSQSESSQPEFEQAPFEAPVDERSQATPAELAPDQVISPVGSGLPVDFPAVLRLAGADNWNVKIAQERICEAVARYNEARVSWLPSLNLGIGYNHHEGEIQATDGTVSTVSRGSLFVGGGARIENHPLTGGAGGPARLFVDFSIADAIYQPLAARQLLSAERSRQSHVFNDTMLAASLGYFELARAQSQTAIAMENLAEAELVLKLTESFVEAGKGTAADKNRLQVIVNRRRRDVVAAKAQVGIASAQLANVLQLDNSKLDPTQGLFAMEAEVLPIVLVQPEIELSELVGQAVRSRREVNEAECRAQSAQTQLKAEKLRPLFPNLTLGLGGGAFGGGTGGNLSKLDSRSDVDVQMVWELRNLGAGNRVARDLRQSELNQSIYVGRQLKDQIANEVAVAYHQVDLHSKSMAIFQDSILQAANSLRINIEAIRDLEGLPLESIQSLEEVASARNGYLDSVIDYNRSQLQLLRAIGEPIATETSLNGIECQ